MATRTPRIGYEEIEYSTFTDNALWWWYMMIIMVVLYDAILYLALRKAFRMTSQRITSLPLT